MPWHSVVVKNMNGRIVTMNDEIEKACYLVRLNMCKWRISMHKYRFTHARQNEMNDMIETR